MDSTKLGPQPEPPDMPFVQIILALILWLINLLGLGQA